MAYRHGNNAINEDSASFQVEAEVDVPDSVDNVFAQVISSNQDEMIHIVHCYSMRNGLHGSPSEAHIFWT